MKLHDMKRTESELEEQKDAMTPASPAEESYPYGLSISLDEGSLEKLGIKRLPAIGQRMKLIAEVKVNSRHESQNATESGEHKSKSLGLQICRMNLSKREAESGEDAVGMGVDEAGY